MHPRYEYTHDAQGNLVGIRDNVYQVGSAIYYAHGATPNDFAEHYEVDAEGGITLRTYDADDNLLSETIVVGLHDSPQNGEADDLVTTYTYDADGNRLTETDVRGNVTTYNQYGEVTAITSAAGRTTHFDYDLNGNQIATWYFAVPQAFQPDLLQILDVTHYDETNRVTATHRLVLPDEHHVTANLTAVDFTAAAYAQYTLWATGTVYNTAGQAVRSVDQQGNASETAHDLRGQPIQTRSLVRQAFLPVVPPTHPPPPWHEHSCPSVGQRTLRRAPRRGRSSAAGTLCHRS